MKIEAFGRQWRTDMNGRIIHSDHPNHRYDPSMVAVSDGIVTLDMELDPKMVEYKSEKYDTYYKTGLIRSVDHFGFGRFTADIVMPTGYFLWPAMWLTGSESWPPEIDIAEGYTSHDRTGYRRNLLTWDIGAQLHYGKSTSPKSTRRMHACRVMTPNPATETVEYCLEWEPDAIRIYYNAFPVLRCTDQEILKQFQDQKMDVVFDIFVQDFCGDQASCITPMVIRDFEYTEF